MKLVLSLVLLLSSVSAFAEGNEAPYNGADYTRKYEGGCPEGQRLVLLEQNAESDTLVRVNYVCSFGEYRQVGGRVASPARISRCVTGSRTTILEQNNESDTSSPVAYVCRAGKWFRK